MHILRSIATNPKSKDWVKTKFKSQLTKFNEKCDLLKSISDDINSMNGEYVESENRPVGLEKKFEALDQLKRGVE